MATINFLYRSTREKAPLVIRLLYRHNDIDFVFGAKTKLEVSKLYWNKEHKRKRGLDINLLNTQTEINEKITEIKNHVLINFDKTNPEYINKEWLQNTIEEFYVPKKQGSELPKDIVNYIDSFIDDRRNELSNSSIKKYNVLKNLLIRYETSIKSKLMIIDIDTNFKKSFENYCLEKLYAPNTIARAIRSVKTICKHAKYRGVETSYQLDNITVKYTKVENIYLTPEEISKIENIKKENLTENLDSARDWLVMSCFLGQRISDFMRFTDKQIRIEKGKPLIEFTQKKTGKLMTVPLHKKVIEILNKRNGKFPPPISDQKYNELIKIVGRIAGLTYKVKGSKKTETKPNSKIYRKESGLFEKCDLISSHIGRRSFATNFYGDIPTTYLIYVTGHSTEAMFLNYIGKSNKDLAMELTNYF